MERNKIWRAELFRTNHIANNITDPKPIEPTLAKVWDLKHLEVQAKGEEIKEYQYKKHIAQSLKWELIRQRRAALWYNYD